MVELKFSAHFQWTILPTQSCLALYSFCAIIIIIIIIIDLLIWKFFFTPVIADSFLRESEWQ